MAAEGSPTEEDWDKRAGKQAGFSHEADVVRWIQDITGSAKGDQSVGEWLKSGVVLCNVVNHFRPAIVKVNQQTMPFKQMENIKNFLGAARELGVPESSVFETNDLYEEKNVDAVLSCVYALGGAVQTACPHIEGPRLGIASVKKGAEIKPKARVSNLIHRAPSDVNELKNRNAFLEEQNIRLQEEVVALRQRADIDIPHWAGETRSLAEEIEAMLKPLETVPLGQKLKGALNKITAVDAGLRGLRAAPIREELAELKRSFAATLQEGLEREQALREELEQLKATGVPTPAAAPAVPPAAAAPAPIPAPTAVLPPAPMVGVAEDAVGGEVPPLAAAPLPAVPPAVEAPNGYVATDAPPAIAAPALVQPSAASPDAPTDA
eukprot:TRINITY_DN23509_c0_g1_i1.p1 TRINITY_DN23509_c0_g1~~TRINITY_DN23509_c0_g1_i1.p1  ORF type:complete len:379 (+),score=104.26 TRINITY_DN23509_c0_g1_i1:37-1173(+)